MGANGRPGLQQFQTAILGPPKDLQYAERHAAERDAEIFREQNAREVASTNRRRKHKIEPATYSVLPVKLEEVVS